MTSRDYLYGGFGAPINAFIEDTCVITVIAYLLARGRTLEWLLQTRVSWRQTLALGLLLGFIALSEIIFPGARYPYVTNTLIVMFAAIISGLSVGLITAGVVAIVAAVAQPVNVSSITILAVLVSALLGAAFRSAAGQNIRPVRGGGVGICVQAGVVLACSLLSSVEHLHYGISRSLASIPANGFGLMLLLFVVRDAQMRAEVIRHRAEAERTQALIAEAKLSALRARIHPHYLFNVLTSIAALCGIAPERAETAIIRLSQQMRRVLAADPTASLCLSEEIEQVQGYLEIEQLRLGDRLRVQWEIDPACARLLVPAFGLQTLVENAVNHGIAPKMEPGTIRIVVLPRRRHATIAVIDNGIGISADARQRIYNEGSAREHGLQILAQQLVLMHGSKGRLRLFGHPEQGTMAVFAVPYLQNAGTQVFRCSGLQERRSSTLGDESQRKAECASLEPEHLNT